MPSGMPRRTTASLWMASRSTASNCAADSAVSLKSAVAAAPYHNVHRRGSDSRQGALLLKSGTLLRAPEIAVAASAGMARVRVSSQPAVMIVSTGDELVEPGDPIADYQVRRSNAYAVTATL